MMPLRHTIARETLPAVCARKVAAAGHATDRAVYPAAAHTLRSSAG